MYLMGINQVLGKWKKQLISNGSEIQQYKAKSQLELKAILNSDAEISSESF
jgi:hypothetical protein